MPKTTRSFFSICLLFSPSTMSTFPFPSPAYLVHVLHRIERSSCVNGDKCDCAMRESRAFSYSATDNDDSSSEKSPYHWPVLPACHICAERTSTSKHRKQAAFNLESSSMTNTHSEKSQALAMATCPLKLKFRHLHVDAHRTRSMT